MIDYSQNQKRRFADEIYLQMKTNNDIYVLVGDLGYRVWDQVRNDFPKRFINTGAAEQSLIGISVGLALNGKIPIAFTVSSFLLYRPFETVRYYINKEKIPVKLVGSGRDRDYFDHGFSHWAEDDKKIMKIFSNIKAVWPKTADEVTQLVPKMIKDNEPWYINLKR